MMAAALAVVVAVLGLGAGLSGQSAEQEGLASPPLVAPPAAGAASPASLLPSEAKAEGSRPGVVDPGAVTFDLGAVIEQVHFAYRPLEGAQDRFSGGHSTYAVEVDAGGARFTPYHAKRTALEPAVEGEPRGVELPVPPEPAEVIEGAPLQLELEGIARGDRSIATAGSGRARVEKDGHVAIERGEVSEHYHNRDEGVEQSWAFDSEPTGSGELRVRLRARGLEYTGETAAGLHFTDARTGLGFRYGHGTWVDARGRETRVDARSVPEGIELVVPAAVLQASAYPAVLDPTISPEFGMDEPVEGIAGKPQVYPRVASNGSDYLVVWQDYRSGSADVYGTRVTSAGVVSDPSGLVIATGTGAPSVASNGSDYLVVWQDYRGSTSDIYGTLVTSAGVISNPSGIPISTAPTHQRTPSIASLGSDYLVVWDDSRNGSTDVYGTRVTSAGVVLDPSGIPISTAQDSQWSASVASNGTGYLVVWWDYRTSATTGIDIYGTRVSSTGEVLDSSGIALSTTVYDEMSVNVASNGTDYLLVWGERRIYMNGSDIYAARVTSAGVLSDPDALSLSTAPDDQFHPSVTSNGSDYLVVWTDNRSDSSHVYGTRVTSTGMVSDPNGLALSTTASGGNASAAWNGSEYLVVWQDYRNGTKEDIYGTRVTAAGAVVDPAGFLLSGGWNDQQTPCLAWNGSDYLVVWQDLRAGSNSDIYGARVTGTGTVLDPSGLALSTSAGNQQQPSVASNGSDYMVVWEDFRSGAMEFGRQFSDIYGTRVSSAGTVVDPDGIALSTVTNTQAFPKIASNGSEYLVIWEDRSVPTIDGTRVTSAGEVLDPNGLAIPVGSTFLYSSVASNGSDYLVAWVDDRTNFPQVYATRVTSAGTVSDPGGLQLTAPVLSYVPRHLSVASNGAEYLVVMAWTSGDTSSSISGTRVTSGGVVTGSVSLSTATNNQPVPRVTSNGSVYLVVWEDYRAGGSDIYGARVTNAGLVEPNTALVADSTTNETQPAIVAGAGDAFLLAYTRFDPTVPATRVRARLLGFGAVPGQSCGADAECETGHCVDGVCCVYACGGGVVDCIACSVAAGAPVDGKCSTLTGTACDDGNVCTVADTCEAGSCKGSNPCDTYCSPEADGVFTCGPCWPGTYSLDGTGATACLPCAGGTYSSSGATFCSPCAVGYYSTPGDPCMECPPGTYSSVAGASVCTAWTDCAPGEHVSKSGSRWTDRVCAACAMGEYSATTNAASCTAWTECVAGEYVSNDATATSDRVCAVCGASKYSTTANAPSCTAWTDCGPGQYVFVEGTATSDRSCASCTACGVGAVETAPCTATSDTVCVPMAPAAGVDAAVDGGEIDGAAIDSGDADAVDMDGSDDDAVAAGGVPSDGAAGTGGASDPGGSGGIPDPARNGGSAGFDAGGSADAGKARVVTTSGSPGGCSCRLGRSSVQDGAGFGALSLAMLLLGRVAGRRKQRQWAIQG